MGMKFGVHVNFNDVFERDGVMEIWIKWEIVTMKNKTK
jgi:hypothetical protein